MPSSGDLYSNGSKRGGGAYIFIIGGIVILGLAGAFVLYISSSDGDQERHVAFRQEVFAPVHTKYYEPFWACVLRDPVKQFKSASDVRDRIKSFTIDRRAQAYADYVKSEPRCLPLLDQAIPAYQTIAKDSRTPPGYVAVLADIEASLDRAKSAWTDFASYQSNYRERHELLDRIQATGEAWVGYQESTRYNKAEKRAHWQPDAMPYLRYIQCVLGDTSYTAFEGGGEEAAAQQKLLDLLDSQCSSNRAAFLIRLEETCKAELVRKTMPDEVAELDRITKHWGANDNDFGSAVPITECISDYEKTYTVLLLDNISKAWVDYVKAYNTLIEINNEKAGIRSTTPKQDRRRAPGS
jgi:hypothetical protein